MGIINEKLYRFIRIKDKSLGLQYKYMLYCDSIQTLVEHNEKFHSPVIVSGITDIFKKSDSDTNSYNKPIEIISDIKGCSIIDAGIYLENKTISGKLNALMKFGNILLRENGSYMTLTERYEIISEVTNSKLIYPDISLEIKLFQWNGGTHWYAKVGNLDVVDDDGNQKWFSKARAQQEAKKFLLKECSYQ